MIVFLSFLNPGGVTAYDALPWRASCWHFLMPSAATPDKPLPTINMTDRTPPRSEISEEQSFRLLVAGVRDYAIFMLDPDGIIKTWNAGAERFKGYAASEILGLHFSVFYTEHDRIAGRPALALRTALDEGKFEDEGWRVRKDGSQFWASVVIDPIRDEAGHLIGFAKITRDITERKAAQEALRESEEQFRLLVQGVTDYAIFMLSPDGEVTSWNPGAERIKRLFARRNPRQTFLLLLYGRRPGQRSASTDARHSPRRRPLRAGRLAGTQGRLALLGPCGGRCNP